MPSKPRTLAGILRSRRHADREYNRTRRDPVVARIHGSARWQALRARVLRDEPLCRECARRGLTQPATQVDHVVLLARTPPVSAAPEASRKGPREGAPQVPGDRSGPPAHPARALGGEVDPRHRRVSVVQTQPRRAAPFFPVRLVVAKLPRRSGTLREGESEGSRLEIWMVGDAQDGRRPPASTCSGSATTRGTPPRWPSRSRRRGSRSRSSARATPRSASRPRTWSGWCSPGTSPTAATRCFAGAPATRRSSGIRPGTSSPTSPGPPAGSISSWPWSWLPTPDVEHLVTFYESQLECLVRDLDRIPRDAFTNPVHVLGELSYWAWCWTAGTEWPGTGEVPNGGAPALRRAVIRLPWPSAVSEVPSRFS